MSGALVRWRPSDDQFEVIGHGRMWFSSYTDVVAPAEVIRPASLTELRRAVDRCRRDRYEGDYGFAIFDAPADQLARDEEMFFSQPVSLELAENRTLVNVTLAIAPEDPPQDRHEVTSMLTPLLSRMGVKLVDFSVDEQMTATVYGVSIGINPRGITAGDALQMGIDILLLWEAGIGGVLTPNTAADLIKSGRADVLVGQFESEWFEAKQAPYRLGDTVEEIELAKDVSALANRSAGGLLVIGLVTKHQGERDLVSRVRPQPMNLLVPRRYRQSLDRWIYPRLRDVLIDVIEVTPGHGLLTILIPPQPEPLWPFLVCGTIIGRKLLGNHFSLVRRRGDETVDDTAAVVHGLMVAGRAALSNAPKSPSDSLER